VFWSLSTSLVRVRIVDVLYLPLVSRETISEKDTRRIGHEVVAVSLQLKLDPIFQCPCPSAISTQTSHKDGWEGKRIHATMPRFYPRTCRDKRLYHPMNPSTPRDRASLYGTYITEVAPKQQGNTSTLKVVSTRAI
jgi:hypothetical protein